MRKTLCALALVIAAAGCSKANKDTSGGQMASGAATASAAPSQPGEPRKVAVEASANGYVPATIEGAPGEKLVLVFTRTVDGDCMAQVKLDGGKPIDLPKDKAVEVPVTVPTTGKLQFACGMDMNTGVVVAKGT